MLDKTKTYDITGKHTLEIEEILEGIYHTNSKSTMERVSALSTEYAELRFLFNWEIKITSYPKGFFKVLLTDTQKPTILHYSSIYCIQDSWYHRGRELDMNIYDLKLITKYNV